MFDVDDTPSQRVLMRRVRRLEPRIASTRLRGCRLDSSRDEERRVELELAVRESASRHVDGQREVHSPTAWASSQLHLALRGHVGSLEGSNEDGVSEGGS